MGLHPKGLDALADEVRRDLEPLWMDTWGEARIELVLIGQDLDEERHRHVLASCLLTDEEWAQGARAWVAFEDPLPMWEAHGHGHEQGENDHVHGPDCDHEHDEHGRAELSEGARAALRSTPLEELETHSKTLIAEEKQDEAVWYQEEIYRRTWEADSTSIGCALAGYLLGLCYIECGEAHRAGPLLQAAIQALEPLAAKGEETDTSEAAWMLCETRSHLIDLLVKLDDVARAVPHAIAGQNEAKSHGLVAWESTFLYSLARIAIQNDELDPAEPLLRKALALREPLAERSLVAPVLSTLGLVLNAKGDKKGAKQMLERAEVLFPRDSDLAEKAECTQALAALRADSLRAKMG
jgi:tetratricopeptide (TPR) repeat protein